MLQVPQLKKLQYEEPYLYEALKKIVGAINALNQRLGADPTAPVVAPSPIAKFSVTDRKSVV